MAYYNKPTSYYDIRLAYHLTALSTSKSQGHLMVKCLQVFTILQSVALHYQNKRQ